MSESDSHLPPVVDNPLFFLDYDGTLAPIVDDPEAAVPHPRAPELLRTLDAQHPLWIVTGRDLPALASFLDRPYNAIGLHGAQHGVIGEWAEHLMSEEAEEALTRLRRSVPEGDGIWVEEKDRAFAVHYRQADDRADARSRLEEWLREVPEPLDAIWGKAVVELRPEDLTKGTAVSRIAAQHPDRTPVYLGDDVTDEDAFKALDSLDRPAVTVKVGPGETNATHRLEGPDAVMEYLEAYV